MLLEEYDVSASVLCVCMCACACVCFDISQVWQEKQSRSRGKLTVEVRPDGPRRQQAVDGDLVDDVDDEEGHAGEAQGLEQAPRVTWRRHSISRI